MGPQKLLPRSVLPANEAGGGTGGRVAVLGEDSEAETVCEGKPLRIPHGEEGRGPGVCQGAGFVDHRETCQIPEPAGSGQSGDNMGQFVTIPDNLLTIIARSGHAMANQGQPPGRLFR